MGGLSAPCSAPPGGSPKLKAHLSVTDTKMLAPTHWGAAVTNFFTSGPHWAFWGLTGDTTGDALITQYFGRPLFAKFMAVYSYVYLKPEIPDLMALSVSNATFTNLMPVP